MIRHARRSTTRALVLAPADVGSDGQDVDHAPRDDRSGRCRTARRSARSYRPCARPRPARTGKALRSTSGSRSWFCEEAEITLDTPVLSPFAGQPEISVDTYLKYVLRQFIWERYVHDGFVLIDGPCDDCEGYATVSVAEAHAWLLLHQVVPVKFPEKTPLGEVLKAISEATKGRGLGGRGLVIATARSAWNDRAVWSKPVTIVANNCADRDLARSDAAAAGPRVPGPVRRQHPDRRGGPDEARSGRRRTRLIRGVDDWEDDFPM